jgi:hypothetical protein
LPSVTAVPTSASIERAARLHRGCYQAAAMELSFDAAIPLTHRPSSRPEALDRAGTEHA